MNKVAIFLCLLFLTACSTSQTVSTSETTGITPTHESLVETSIPISTADSEMTENAPSVTQQSTSNNTSKPYDFSNYIETDFSLINPVVPNGPCSGDMTIEMCIDYYGTKPAIPDGISVELYNEDDNYQYYSISNSLTRNSVDILIAKGMYDSHLSDVQYSLNENNELLISFFYDYDDVVVDNQSDSYDISERYYKSGGPIYSHTIYYLIENNGFQMNGTEVDSNDHFSLIKQQNFDLYIQSMNNVEYAEVGTNYLESCILVDLVN